jgi:hypothetical protein
MPTTRDTYYVEGIHYSNKDDLLSDGWAEDKKVNVYAPGGAESATTIRELRTSVVPRRVVAVANESYSERMPSGSVQYAVALITEDEPGWSAGGWWSTLEDAEDSAKSFNAVAGHSRDTVLDVQVSSMRVSRTR